MVTNALSEASESAAPRNEYVSLNMGTGASASDGGTPLVAISSDFGGGVVSYVVTGAAIAGGSSQGVRPAALEVKSTPEAMPPTIAVGMPTTGNFQEINTSDPNVSEAERVGLTDSAQAMDTEGEGVKEQFGRLCPCSCAFQRPLRACIQQYW